MLISWTIISLSHCSLFSCCVQARGFLPMHFQMKEKRKSIRILSNQSKEAVFWNSGIGFLKGREIRSCRRDKPGFEESSLQIYDDQQCVALLIFCCLELKVRHCTGMYSKHGPEDIKCICALKMLRRVIRHLPSEY